MKNYDFKKAISLITENKDKIANASLGMHEDWFWTAEEIYNEEKGFTREFPENPAEVYAEYVKARNAGVSLLSEELRQYDNVMIGGINGSSWATPTLQIIYKDGTEKMTPCYISDGLEESKPVDAPWLGVLSAPVQDNITPLSE